MSGEQPTNPLDLFDIQERGGVQAIWFWPDLGDGKPAGFAFEMIGGPKSFARIFLDRLHEGPDWGWVVRDDAVLVWKEPDAGA